MNTKAIWPFVRRALCPGVCLLMCISLLTGCGREEAFTFDSGVNLSFSNGTTLVSTVREALKRHDKSITLTYRASDGYMDDIGSMVTEIMDAACENTDDPKEGDYIKYQLGGYDYDYGHVQDGDRYIYQIIITPSYYSTITEEQSVDEKVEEIINGFAFDKNTDDLEKIRAVYDYVCDNVSYDELHMHNHIYHLDATAYAALCKGTASCQGYSVLMFRLLKELGIENKIVTGYASRSDTSDAEYHSWNLVCIDGEWLNVDATWGTLFERDDYFLKTDEEFTDHVRE